MIYQKRISSHSVSRWWHCFWTSSFKINTRQCKRKWNDSVVVKKRLSYSAQITYCWIIWIHPATVMRYVHGSRCRSETTSQSANEQKLQQQQKGFKAEKTKQKSSKNQANKQQSLKSHSPRFNSQVTINQLISFPIRELFRVQIFAAMNDIEQNEEKPNERKAIRKKCPKNSNSCYRIIRMNDDGTIQWQPTNK